MALPAIIQGVGAIGGFLQGERASKEAKDRLAQMVAAISGIPVPELEKYTPEELINMGNFTPEELQAVGILGPSAQESIQLDPRLRADQETALSQARERALRGFTAEDAAMLDQYMRQAGSTAQSATQAALTDMNRRGMSGSGNALAAALAGTQNAANLQSQQAMQQAAMRLQAQDRNTDALSRMAAGLEATDYGRAMDLAQSRDSIEKFNQQLRQNVASTNVANRNTANLRNLELSQRLADQNVANRNQAQLEEQKRQQDMFNMNLRKATGQAGMISNQNQQIREMDKGRADAIGGLIGGAGKWLGSDAGTSFLDSFKPSTEEGQPAIAGSRMGSFPTKG